MCWHKLRKILGVLFILGIIVLLSIGLLNYVNQQLKQGDTDIIFELISINLTLFGFGLVAGIFEKKAKNLKFIERKLFLSSLIFLSSSIFLFAYAGLNSLPESDYLGSVFKPSTPLLLIGAILMLFIGLLFMFLDLDEHLDLIWKTRR